MRDKYVRIGVELYVHIGTVRVSGGGNPDGKMEKD